MLSENASRNFSNAFKARIRPIYYALFPTPTPASRTATAPAATNVCTPAIAPTPTETDRSVAPADVRAAPTPASTAKPTPAKPKDVRKYAHFAEYAALGLLTALFALTYGKPRVQRAVNVLAFGLAVAVADESIQILSGRGPEVPDILLDVAGYTTGALAVMVLWLLYALLRATLSIGARK